MLPVFWNKPNHHFFALHMLLPLQTAVFLCAPDWDGKACACPSAGALILCAKNSCTHTNTWSSGKLLERNIDLGLKSEKVQLGHSYAPEQSRYIDRSLTDGFWMPPSQSGEAAIHCASLGHTEIPHTSLVL